MYYKKERGNNYEEEKFNNGRDSWVYMCDGYSPLHVWGG